MYPACHLLNFDLKTYEAYNLESKTCKTSTLPYPGGNFALNRAGMYPWVDFSLLYSIIMRFLLVAARNSCLLHDEFSDFNFMPFRFRLKHNCITSFRSPQILKMSTCINYKKSRTLETYVTEQLFHFYPLIRTPQKIYQYTVEPPSSELKCCLAVDVPSHFDEMPTLSTASSYSFTVTMKSCNNMKDLNQLFVVEVIDNVKATNKNKIKGHYDAKANMKPLSIVKIKWTWKLPRSNGNYTYCLFSPAINATSSSLIVRDCSSSRDTPLSVSNIVKAINMNTFLLERSTSNGIPYKSGLKIGH